MLTYYIRKDEEGYIVDVVTYDPSEQGITNYIPFEYDGELPRYFYSGVYKISESGELEIDEERLETYLLQTKDQDYVLLLNKYNTLSEKVEELTKKLESK